MAFSSSSLASDIISYLNWIFDMIYALSKINYLHSFRATRYFDCLIFFVFPHEFSNSCWVVCWMWNTLLFLLFFPIYFQLE